MSSVNSTLTRLCELLEYSLTMQQDLWMQHLENVLSQDLNGISAPHMLPLTIVHLRTPPIQANLLELAIHVRRPSTPRPSHSS